MTEQVLIWGAGAIGGTIGAFLARAGHEVLMVDVAQDHVDRMQANGIEIEGPVDAFVTSVRAVTPDMLKGQFEKILLAVKSQDTPEALEALKPHLAVEGYVVSVQNGLNESSIANAIGANRTIGCFINFGADYVEPGRILYGGRGAFVVGEIDGQMTDRLHALRDLLSDFEPDVQITDNVNGYLWAKIAFTAVLIAQTISNEPTEEFLDNPRWRPLVYQMVHEVAVAANAEGIMMMSFQAFDPLDFLTGDKKLMKAAIDGYAEARRGSKKLYSGIWRDIVVRKRPTEMSNHGEPVISAASRNGKSVTTYARSLEMIAEVEAGKSELGEDLANELLAVALSASKRVV